MNAKELKKMLARISLAGLVTGAGTVIINCPSYADNEQRIAQKEATEDTQKYSTDPTKSSDDDTQKTSAEDNKKSTTDDTKKSEKTGSGKSKTSCAAGMSCS